jgi:hypothetical protein
MKETTDRPICHRADDMVTFLYGEAIPAEAADFTNHMRVCASCRAEFSLLTQVRESVSLWRAEVLGAVWRPEAATQSGPLGIATTEAPKRSLSAIAALREFFAVSPVWLRGAAVMATLVLCLLAALFAARMLRSSQQLYTQQEVDAKVNKLLDQRMKESNATKALADGSSGVQISKPNDSIPVEEASLAERNPTPRHSSGPRSSRRFLSRAEREQLATDLRLKPSGDEDSSFLLDGGSN